LDFATRNRYRSAIEELARDSEHRETDVARHAVEAAQASGGSSAAAQEPGYYLIGPGREAFEARLHYRRPKTRALQRVVQRAGSGGYLAVTGLLCAAALYAIAQLLHPLSVGRTTLLLVLLVLPLSDAIIAIINSVVTRLIKPESLPALDLGGVVTEEFRTLVA